MPPAPWHWHAANIRNRNPVTSGTVRGGQPQNSQNISIDRAARWGPLTVLVPSSLLARAYFLGAALGIERARETGNGVVLSLPGAVLLAVRVRGPVVRTWPLYIACSEPANFPASMMYGDNAPIAGGFTVINMIEVLCGVPVPSARGWST